jgi:hypothetical protein
MALLLLVVLHTTPLLDVSLLVSVVFMTLLVVTLTCS